MKNILKLGALAAVGTLVLAGCAANEQTAEPTSGGATSETAVAETLSGTLNGSGASSMAAGQEAWIAAFQIANPGVTVNYDPTGSGTGRAQFFEGATSFIAYAVILETTPAPTVRPPSRIAKRKPCSIATGAINSTSNFKLSPGITISVPSGKVTVPVTSVVRK